MSSVKGLVATRVSTKPCLGNTGLYCYIIEVEEVVQNKGDIPVSLMDMRINMT